MLLRLQGQYLLEAHRRCGVRGSGRPALLSTRCVPFTYKMLHISYSSTHKTYALFVVVEKGWTPRVWWVAMALIIHTLALAGFYCTLCSDSLDHGKSCRFPGIPNEMPPFNLFCSLLTFFLLAGGDPV